MMTHLSGNGVEFSLAILCDKASLLILFSGNDVDLLELFEQSPDQTLCGLVKFRLPASTVLQASVHLGEGTNTTSTAKVYLPGKGCCADEVPVGIIRSQLLEGARLDQIVPLGKIDLTRLLVMSRKGRNEVSCWDVFNSNPRHLLLNKP